jgi:DNA-nicking Smr family endonuclease
MNLSSNNPSDSKQFREAVGNVRPLKADERHQETRARASLPKIRSAGPATNELQSAAPPDAAVQAKVAEASQASRALLRDGLPRKVLRKLGSEACPVQDTIDLHGLTAQQASRVLARLLAEALQRQYGCIRVVHGKGLRSGGPAVLKIMSWQQLWQHPGVLAIKPCAPGDGGTGAVLVLLDTQQGMR